MILMGFRRKQAINGLELVVYDFVNNVLNEVDFDKFSIEYDHNPMDLGFDTLSATVYMEMCKEDGTPYTGKKKYVYARDLGSEHWYRFENGKKTDRLKSVEEILAEHANKTCLDD